MDKSCETDEQGVSWPGWEGGVAVAVGVLVATGGGRAGVMTFIVDGASRSDLTHE